MQPQRMHYSCQVDIATTRDRVLALMTDPQRAHEWQPGLERYESVEGERGRPGSVSRLHFAGAPGDGVMTERVETLDESSYDVVYLLGPVRNENHNSFTDLPDTTGVLLDLAGLTGGSERTLVFTRTKYGAKKLTKQLNGRGVPAVELHGNLGQNARVRNLDAFHSGTVQTLVAVMVQRPVPAVRSGSERR